MMATMGTPRVYRVVSRAGRAAVLTWQGINHLLWPPVCRDCGRGICVEDDELCRDCWSELATCTAGDYCPRCGRDASRYGLVGGACGACRSEEFHFDGIARAGVYTEALQRMILAFKHDHSELASTLAPLAQASLEGSSFCDDVELFVPVPLHWTRRVLRGYNQANLIARRLRHPRARVIADLVRVRRTRPQPQAATPAARARNVAGAFVVRDGHEFAGRTVCLIDDIKTSGATLNECARAIKEAGAAKVYALVLAVAGQRPA
ncbi:MAG TPA: ComF family protein [Sedimentisphaerales bacterium]|jgi:ComF family protein|nr:ComF family protein [Sedimentisphaerales bacterium]HNU30305.1 ComF family protein [Sedimentisphaerales bacterium]